MRVFDITEYGEKVETFQLVDSSSIPDPPPGGIGGSEEAEIEAELEEEVLEELEAEGWVPVPDDGVGNGGLGEAPPEKRQEARAIVLNEVDRAVLVGEGALGARV